MAGAPKTRTVGQKLVRTQSSSMTRAHRLKLEPIAMVAVERGFLRSVSDQWRSVNPAAR